MWGVICEFLVFSECLVVWIGWRWRGVTGLSCILEIGLTELWVIWVGFVIRREMRV